MNPADTGKEARALRPALLFFTLFSLFLLTVAVERQETLPGVSLVGLPSGGGKILLLQERDGVVWLVCSGADSSLLLKLDGATGKELLRRKLDFPLQWAALRGDELLVLEELEAGSRLICWDSETLEKRSFTDLKESYGDLMYFDCDSSETIFSVGRKNRSILKIKTDGIEKEQAFPEAVSFLGVDGHDGLYVYAGDSLYVRTGGEEDFRQISGLACPKTLLGPGRWLDGEGMVRLLGEEGASALFQISEPVFSSRFYCLDRENCLIVSAGSGNLRRYGPSGEGKGACLTDGTLRALCGMGAVCETGEGFSYVPLAFSQPGEGPSPSPSPSPSPEPEAPAWLEGEYLVAPPGTTAAEIRELLRPDVAEIRDVLGNRVTWGRLATGMTVNRWTVVVLGDCDGTGAVSGSDVRRAMAMSLEGDLQEGPYFRAADLDEDGAVGAEDLVRLSAMAAAGK